LISMPSEYNHLEGGLAIPVGLPILILMQQEIQRRGIAYLMSGRPTVFMPEGANRSWLKSAEFTTHFDSWCESVKSRNRVFLGYSGRLRKTAQAISQHLNSIGVSVFDWYRDMRHGGSLMDEMAGALASSATSIFLFGHDEDSTVTGNLTFEMGYFAKARGLDRTLVICERGAKLPIDFAAVTAIFVDDLFDIAPIQAQLRAFIYTKLY
jgi:Predicted nucleotide-binding protein containing TIR-like domain